MNPEKLNAFQLHSIFESGATSESIDEIIFLASQICHGTDCSFLYKVHSDVASIFSGQYPGFRASATKYHNLRHTYSVVLASVRLFHGLFLENHKIPAYLVIQGLLSAYFHDSGMLLQTNDRGKTGANYTKFHEKRSIVILKNYLKANSFPNHYHENCETIIKFTNLDYIPNYNDDIDEELKLACHAIGSADLLAQMADRYYLESLPLLFQEHQDGGIEEHSSAIDLMRNTIGFHEKVFKTRIIKTLGNIAPAMRAHFRERWNIDKNLYQENIDLNIAYLNRITEDCSMDLNCWGKYLRRTPPSTP